MPKSAEELFAAALELTNPADRAALLDRECAGHSALRAEVESLLAAHEQASKFLENPPAAAVAETLAVTTGTIPVNEKPGDRIGRYKLLEQIGEGGFGTVWMAEQAEPVRRRVALKIIKLGMDTKQVIARFEAERQALALMDHPSIAHVFDGGATQSGRPYFVMELVRGAPITRYCDDRRLTVEERLELFGQVCQAVHHAHQKGVIHRDLKPNNILVTDLDGRALPKVIDFGVARATTHRLTEKTVFTHMGQMMGTPTYMSPEQAGLGGLDIDARTDVYSLGVVLYELLTGRTPFESGKLPEAGYDSILRSIRETEPLKPSTRLSSLSADDLNCIAQQRRAEPGRLNRAIRGELDWIVMRALDKDRNRRYASAEGLAQDLRRYLRHQPLEAGPPSFVYRLSKTARRHRIAIGFAAALALPTMVSVTVMVHRTETHATHPPASEQLPAAVAALPAAEVLKIAYSARPPPAPAQAVLPQLQLAILAQRQGASSAGILQDGDVLRSELDPYAIVLRPVSAGYLYVFQVDSSGNKEWLFPRNEVSKFSSGANPVSAGQVLVLPSATNGVYGFYLDHNSGIEHVYAVFSAARWLDLETALASPGPPVVTIRSTLLAHTVEEPNGLRYRGVGGISTNTVEFQFESVFGNTNQKATHKVPIQSFEASESFMTIERWFRHVK